ncbi:class I SAM-dependent methyltransferase [Heyndrickxia camelliae]|uniref:Class I SAM-dependent methyltransferase n=1 Tax=Heyndrickxia camelliae TaxID=1707093 RepID=A0A2N3LI21_9BACI|nr:class I SAM-dependent methyltransferase [Heyndrickxia camelliae]PKR84235.1 class I SAM-dependent methyltransferase [Heyndrickxia camelliae]
MDRIRQIRKEEKKYHDYCYDNYSLFETGSWLHKPVKTVIDFLPMFEGKEEVNVLDIGCGVGRNSIPIAEKIKNNEGKVVCVDLLDSALEHLKKYSMQYGVSEVIETVQADIGEFKIKPEEYDFIIAVSSLEHVESEEVFDDLLKRMRNGTKIGGIHCLVINSEVQEIEQATNQSLEAYMEVNLSTKDMLQKLEDHYHEWNIVMKVVKPLEYKISRDGKGVILTTNAITYVAVKAL